MSTDQLNTLTLVDGIPAMREGQTLHYRQVRLRETNVGHERVAVRLSERVVMVAGQQKLLVSDADFRYCMTMLAIDQLQCEDLVIPHSLIDLELFGKLTSHDLGLIESRVFVMTMAAELRYGNITQAQFDAVLAGQDTATQGPQGPHPVGQAPDLGQAPGVARPGPALLADFAGSPAAGAPEANG